MQDEAKQQDYVFALDIGTRDIIGVVGFLDGEKLRVDALETVEHPRRAMVDGQIEDIEQVGRIAAQVKEALEKKVGFPLERVCVAAAGRALRTQRAAYSMELDSPQTVTEETICRLEAGAVQAAEELFGPETDEKEPMFLVGYTVVEYLLDGYPMSNLLEHRGRQLSVEVIATFLPREVVNSLYIAMHRAGLEVASLTLEPIAAINAAIPQNLRLLNLALVDIGAGTSDIAISRDGSVASYTMATVAGDEITETIMKKYLVDFATAEALKLCLGADEDMEYQDILGFKRTVAAYEVRDAISSVTHSLCTEIGERILEANGGNPPSAVFLVGGGSKLPGLCAEVADFLGMESTRVALGGGNFTMSVVSPDYELTSPEYATPLGIAVSTALNLINDSFTIKLNGENAKLFRSGKLTALDVLMMNGYSFAQLMNRSGQSLSIELNGEKRILRGTHSVPAALKINGEEADLSTIIKAGDKLDFIPAVPGENASVRLEDIVAFNTFGRVSLLDSTFSLGTHVFVNGEIQIPGYELKSRDSIQTVDVRVLGDLLNFAGGSAPEDGVMVNGKLAPPDYPLKDGDVITCASSAALGAAVSAVPHARAEKEPDVTAELPPVEEEARVEELLPVFVKGPEEPEPARFVWEQPDKQELEQPTVKETERPEETLEEIIPFDDAKGFEVEDFLLPHERSELGEEAPCAQPHQEKQEQKAPLSQTAPEDMPRGEDEMEVEPELSQTAPQIPEDGKPAMQAHAESAPVEVPASVASQPEPQEPEKEAETALTPSVEKGFNSDFIHFNLNGAPLALRKKPDDLPYLLLDMLNLVDIDLSKPQGRIVLKVNGEDSPYRRELADRDDIIIRWDRK